MLALEIDDRNIETSLKAVFKSQKEIKEYVHNLILEDLEDRRLLNILKHSQEKEYVSKDEIFSVLDEI